MANLDTSGLLALALDLEQLAVLPDDTIWEMVDAGAQIIADGHRAELRAENLVDTGTLAGSVKVHKKRRSGEAPYALIYPDGKHHTYRARETGQIMTARAGEIGFVLEYGGHGVFPRQWMRAANEKNIDKAVDAEARVYDQHLKDCGF